MTGPLQNAVDFYKSLRTRLLEDMPELEHDPDCLLDTLEGATDVNGQLTLLLRSAVWDEAQLDGLKALLTEMHDRADAILERSKRKRRIALHYMIDLGIRNITAPDMTISVRAGAQSVVIVDPTLIPDEYCRIKREPNKTAIKIALQAGRDVRGTCLSNAPEHLAIKV